MNYKIRIFIFFIITSTSVFSQTKWSFEFCGGIPYNLPSNIKIHQSGFDDIKISNAKFYSEPFALPPYWDWRFCYVKKNRVIELEAIHHKLYLDNMPDEIKRFSISHGFNMFFINYCKVSKCSLLINDKVLTGDVFFRVGLGAVFAHPETEIRGYIFEDKGEFLNTNYYLSGPAINLGIGKRWYLLKRLYFNTEIKSTVAYAKIPVALGYAKVFTSSVQFIGGLGFDFVSKE
ncbi:MAG: hypothetical protein HY951_00320 [Bacteroidia bacterium]|nr:hypothetical protein [Bacteroidia bacterium]